MRHSAGGNRISILWMSYLCELMRPEELDDFHCENGGIYTQPSIHLLASQHIFFIVLFASKGVILLVLLYSERTMRRGSFSAAQYQGQTT